MRGEGSEYMSQSNRIPVTRILRYQMMIREWLLQFCVGNCWEVLLKGKKIQIEELGKRKCSEQRGQQPDWYCVFLLVLKVGQQEDTIMVLSKAECASRNSAKTSLS